MERTYIAAAHPLSIAVLHGNKDAVDLLLERGADIHHCYRTTTGKGSKHDQTALHHAAHIGNLKAVQLALDSGAKVMACDNSGETALHKAATQGSEEVVALLIAAGADACATTKFGNFTPMHYAALQGNLGVMKLLHDAGADVNALDEHGWTPLQCAIGRAYEGDENYAKDFAVVEWLLSNGARVDLGDVAEENTPMQIAISSGSGKAIEKLLADHTDGDVIADDRMVAIGSSAIDASADDSE